MIGAQSHSDECGLSQHRSGAHFGKALHAEDVTVQTGSMAAPGADEANHHLLLVMRHAKSSWNTPGLADHDRPLAPRGVRATAALLDHFTDLEIVPDLVLCSSATRAVETWKRVAGAFPPATAAVVEDELYGASDDHLLGRLCLVPEQVGSVLLIGHNPGVEDLCSGLVGAGDPVLQARLEAKFPTGALATFFVPVPWDELDWGGAELIGFVVPRNLEW
jgi:phosphohistidine phosphatase